MEEEKLAKTTDAKRGRGRPRKQLRTEPPKVDAPVKAADPAPLAEKPDRPEPVAKSKTTGRFVTINIPIEELTGTGYQVSRAGYPRQIRNRKLTERQGIILAMVRLGMIREGEAFDATKQHFIAEGVFRKAIDSKEEVVCRLLEFIADAVDAAKEK